MWASEDSVLQWIFLGNDTNKKHMSSGLRLPVHSLAPLPFGDHGGTAWWGEGGQ